MMLGSIGIAVPALSAGYWLLAAGAALLALYLLGTWNYDYFRRRGVPSSRPRLPFLGDFARMFAGMEAMNDAMARIYRQGAGHGVYGVFEIARPIAVIRDPELVKIVAVKDFDNFMNHRDFALKMEPILSKNLFNLNDQVWRDMRATVSPAFTTSKLKFLVPLISQCADQTTKYLLDNCSRNDGTANQRLETNMKDIFTRYTNDVIATATFGMSCDSLKHPENEFYCRGKKITTFNKISTLLMFISMAFPKVAELLRIHILDQKCVAFFDSLVHENIRERQKRGIFRPDVLQLLMQARDGQLKAEGEAEAGANADAGAAKGKAESRLTDNDISAQAIIFFFAGFETVSTALCFITYALSHHPEAQKQLQAEIDDVMKETDKQPTYEAIQAMKYMEAVINESMRMYPLVAATDRLCQKDVILPAGKMSDPVKISKGTLIHIPVIGLHNDPLYWDDPKVFNPDRFMGDNKQNITPYTFMPFGVGPRICVAQRFAMVEIKLALFFLLSALDFHPSSKTKYPLEYAKGANLSAKGGFWCELTPRNR